MKALKLLSISCVLVLTGCQSYSVKYLRNERNIHTVADMSSVTPGELTEIVYQDTNLVNVIRNSKELNFEVPIAGYRKSSSFGFRWGTMHKGVDLAVTTGTEVHAAMSGVVSKVSVSDTGYGKSIVIDHGIINGSRYYTRYAHLNAINCTVGCYVTPEDIIGYSGNTGDSTGPHLHFEIIKDNEAVDPEEFVIIE